MLGHRNVGIESRRIVPYVSKIRPRHFESASLGAKPTTVVRRSVTIAR
jgi:hypothetical protein